MQAEPTLWQALLRNKLLPATYGNPQTAFTFNLMKYFHNLMLEAMVNHDDFIRGITRYSNNEFPSDLPVGEEKFACLLSN